MDEAFTADMAAGYAFTAHYDVAETLTSLGIGEAFVTVLTPKGVPTPPAATRLVPSGSMMGAVDATTRSELIAAGGLREKHGTSVDRESAHEILTGKLAGAAETADAPPLPPPPPREGTTRPEGRAGAATRSKGRPKAHPKGNASEKSMGDQAKDIGIGLAKDLFTTADGRRTLRTVFGTLLGKK